MAHVTAAAQSRAAKLEALMSGLRLASRRSPRRTGSRSSLRRSWTPRREHRPRSGSPGLRGAISRSGKSPQRASPEGRERHRPSGRRLTSYSRVSPCSTSTTSLISCTPRVHARSRVPTGQPLSADLSAMRNSLARASSIERTTAMGTSTWLSRQPVRKGVSRSNASGTSSARPYSSFTTRQRASIGLPPKARRGA